MFFVTTVFDSGLWQQMQRPFGTVLKGFSSGGNAGVQDNPAVLTVLDECFSPVPGHADLLSYHLR